MKKYRKSKHPLIKFNSKLRNLKDLLKIKMRFVYSTAVSIIDKRPLLSVYTLLLILLILIVIGNIIRKPKEEPLREITVKKSRIYRIGQAPKLSLSGQVDKSGVIQISALAGGVVRNISVREGDKVVKGNRLLSLSTNYQGGNALTLSRMLAQKQNTLIEESYPIQKELISKQRDLADKTKDNADKLKDISAKSVDDTNNLINLNNNIISSLDTSLSGLESSPSANAALITSTKQLKSQFQSANLQLNSQIRNINYQIDSNNPPSELAGISHEIAIKQLDIQEKALNLNKEISLLQLQLALVNEALMYPSSPLDGTVQKVFVRTGQAVSPGSPLFTVSATSNRQLTLTVLTSKEIIDRISRTEPAFIVINGTNIPLKPFFFSAEAVSGNLYSIIYAVPEGNYPELTDKSFVRMEIPVGYADTSTAVPFVPLDSLFQTQSDAFLFILKDGKAESRKVETGAVIGSFVQIQKGLNSGDMVILDRTVVSGDKVESIQ